MCAVDFVTMQKNGFYHLRVSSISTKQARPIVAEARRFCFNISLSLTI
jgi:hypothetical protein